MYKNYTRVFCVHYGLVHKTLLIMKLTTILLIISMLQLSAASFGQKVTLRKNNISVENILWEIRKQTGYDVLISTTKLKNSQKLNINFNQTPVAEVVEKIIEGRGLTYTIESRSIVILENDAPKKVNIQTKASTDIKGKVTDEKGLPLSGATVVEKGTKNYVLTDQKGEFSIKVASAEASLTISYIGYTTRTVSAGSGPINISLQPDSQNLNDVVVTGYQKIKKESLTGSVTKIKVADMKVASMGTLDKMLQGQVAGVTVETASAVFGTAPKIRIRGSSSLSGINEPLWVLDGVPLEAPLNIAPSELYSGGARNLLASALSGVNPEDIEDITVLRDATATAMYGTRAVNGVIIISTKRAKKNSALNINYSSNATFTMKPSITDFDVLNSKDQTTLNQEIFNIYQNALMSFSAENSGAYSKLQYLRNTKQLNDEQYRMQVKGLKETNTDWFNELYKNSLLQQHSLSASYGGEKATGRLSVSYYNDMGKTIGEKVDRYTVNLTSGYQITDRLSADLMLKYSNRNQRNPGTQVNPFIYARDASRAMRPYNENGGFEFYKKGYTDFNIINEINNNYIKLASADFLVQLDLKYRFSDKLRLSGIFNTRAVNNESNEIQTEYSNYANQFRQMGIVDMNGFMLTQNDRNPRLYKIPSNPGYLPPVSILPEGGILDRETSTSKFVTGRLQLDWDALYTQSGHKITLFGGAEATSNEQNGYFNRGYGYLSESKTTIPNYLATQRLIQATNLPADERRMYNGRNLLAGTNYYYTEQNRHTVAFYGNASYSFRDKYILDLSLRQDATNVTFSKFTPTWAAGIAWNVSKESFMKGFGDQISDLKLRASYGLRGNDGVRGPDMIAYYTNITRVYPDFNTTSVGIIEPENTDLKFEKEHIFSAGVDLTLLKAIDLSFNYYRRNNFDLLGNRQVAPSLGYTNKVFNWANMRNEGVELSINLRPVTLARDLSLNVMFNAAYNKNSVLSDLTGSNPTIYQIANSNGYALQGKPVLGLYAFRLAGLSSDGLPQYYDKDGNIVKSFLQTNTDIRNLEYQGSRDPLYSGGFTPTIRYRNMSLSAAFIFNAGHKVRMADFYRGGTMNSLFRDDTNIPGDFADRWTAPGNESHTVIPRLITENDRDNYNNAGFFDTSIFTAYNYNDMRTVNASYLRFRNLNFQYSFNELAKRLKMQNLSLGAEASNIAIWTSKRLKGQDPETLLNGLNIPPVKTFTISLNASF